MVSIGEKLDDHEANNKQEGRTGRDRVEDSRVSSVGVMGIHPRGNM